MIKLGLNENFICRIWENKSFYSSLKTTNDEIIEVIDLGVRNRDSGPDYKDAIIKINGATFKGSIEIHQTFSDWYLHDHQGDDKYNDLILHVVFYGNENFRNEDIKLRKSRRLPAVILSEFLTASIHDIWKEIINNPSPEFRLPCYPQGYNAGSHIIKPWLDELSSQRLNQKSEKFRTHLNAGSDITKKALWEKVLFQFTSEALGYSKNKIPFLALSGNLDLTKLKEMSLSRTCIDSLMFGVSGFLHDMRFKDEYVSSLKSEWSRLQGSLKPSTLNKAEWNFFRLRPANFPTLRIAYASAFLYELNYCDLFKRIIRTFEESTNVMKGFDVLLSSLEVNSYWLNHYNFGKECRPVKKIIGNERIRDIVINVFLPLIDLYAVYFDKKNLSNRIIYFHKKEKQRSGGNEVVRVMEKQLKVKVYTISDEQALIQLHNNYCMKGKCYDCAIGNAVFEISLVQEPMRIILY